MHSEESTSRPGRGKLKLAAVLGAAALAIPGAGIVSSAIAADGGPGAPTTQQQAPGDGVATPLQSQEDGSPDRERPDGRDCPKEDGGGSGSGSGDSSGTSADTAI